MYVNKTCWWHKFKNTHWNPHLILAFKSVVKSTSHSVLHAEEEEKKKTPRDVRFVRAKSDVIWSLNPVLNKNTDNLDVSYNEAFKMTCMTEMNTRDKRNTEAASLKASETSSSSHLLHLDRKGQLLFYV